MSFLEILRQTDRPCSPTPRSPASLCPGRICSLDQLVERIQGEHQRCQTAIALGLLHGRNAGDYLLQAIALVPSEEWNSWLSDRCQMSAKTAATYMQIAQGWPSVDKMSERKSHQPALPTGENDSEKPDVALPERKGEINPPINPPITVNSETVLNPITVNSVDVIPETENQTENQTENLPTGDSPMWSFASPPVASEETAASTTSKPESSAESSPESSAESSAKIYSFWIPGNVTPKARPRVTKNGTFFPQRYREWRLKAQGEILMQIHRMNPPLELPLKTAALRIILYGKHRGDGDNAIGSVCDALVSAGVLPSDSLKYLPYGSWRHIKSEETGVKIEIKPLS